MTGIPNLATDCHIHLFGPADRFPFSENRAYTPKVADEDDTKKMMEHLGLGRVVVVHASVYGDNSRLLHGLTTLGDKARGVMLLTGSESVADLRKLDAAGIRGVRLVGTSGIPGSPDGAARFYKEIASRIADLGWHIQVYMKGDGLMAALTSLDGVPVPLVIDHFGLLSADKPEDAELRNLVMDRVAAGHCWVKLSASYRLKDGGVETARHLTHQLIGANPERLVWGSDWPHTPLNRDPKVAKIEQPFRDIDTKQLLMDFLDTVPSDEMRRRILVENPAKLYRFGDA